MDNLDYLCDLWGRGSLHPAERSSGFHAEFLKMLAGATAADRASLMVLSEPEGALVIEASIGLPLGVAEQTRVPIRGSISGWVASHQRPLLLWPGQNLPDAVVGAMQNPSISCAMSVPIVRGKTSVGVLNLARCGGRQPFDDSHVRFATLAGLAMGSVLQADSADYLAGQEHFLSRVLENIPSSTVIVNRELRVVAANQVFLKKSRRSTKAISGRPLAEVVPSALLRQAQAPGRIEQVFQTGLPVEAGKIAYRAANSLTHAYSIRFAPIATESAEEVRNVMMVMDDITEAEKLGAEARQAQRALATMKASEQDLMIWLDSEGAIVSWNAAAERVTGRVIDEVEGLSMAELCAGSDREICQDALREVAMGSHVRGLEMMLLGAEQRCVAVSWYCSPTGDDDGEVAGMVAVGRDLTEHHSMEQLLIQSDKLASLGVMAGGIAHQLRNPLAIIAMSAGLAKGSGADEALREKCLEKIDTATKRASEIIDNLLKFARPQSDQTVLIDVAELLEASFRLTSDQLVSHRVTAHVDASDHLSKVLGSPGLLQQVFINLSLNACDAMPSGGHLAASIASGSDGTVRIAFRDIGEGIPPENLPRLFDPFFTTEPAGPGRVGLGLSTAYGIVKQHGGAIEVESEPGCGSTFTVSLPAA